MYKPEMRTEADFVIMWLVAAGFIPTCLRGIRYGSELRLYKGYLDFAVLAPLQHLASSDIACFCEYQVDDPSRRKIVLFLRSGKKLRLPRVQDPDKLVHHLLNDVGVFREFR